jgi:hypothetical protein
MNYVETLKAIIHNMSGSGGGIHILDGPTGDKSQSGMPPEIEARFHNTALNPALLDVRCAFLGLILYSRMPLSFTPLLRLKRCHACDQ